MAQGAYSVLVSLIALLLFSPIVGVNQNIVENHSELSASNYDDGSRDGDYDVSLEFAGSKVPPELMRLLPDKELMVGVITVVANKLETPEEVKKNILLSLKYVDYERLIPCSNCGMAPLPEKIVLDKIKALGKGTALASK